LRVVSAVYALTSTDKFVSVFLPNLLQTLLSVCLEPRVWEIKEMNNTRFPDA